MVLAHRHPDVQSRAEALLPALVALCLGTAAALLGWRGADLPAQLFRIELFRRHGLALWNNQWYGGHFTFGYSIITPVLGAFVGPVVLGVASAIVASVCFDRLLRVISPNATFASLLFAAGTVTNLAVGRLTFALGMAFGLAALLAAQRGYRVVAVVLTVLCPLASPVAGAFLALAWATWALTERRWTGAALAGASLAPILLIGLIFPSAGAFPYRWPALVMTFAVCAGGWLVLPREQRLVRNGFALYGAAAALTFLVPSPLGGNVNRLGMYVAAPLLVALTDRKVIVALGLPVLLLWQWTPAVDAIARAGDDLSTHREYHEPLLRFLAGVEEPSRVEIPFTKRHFEAFYVANDFAIARGWERQLDIEHNPIFYEPVLSVADYHQWLIVNGVSFVALPDAELDDSAIAEAALLATDLPFLRPVWRDVHWQVWEVIDSPGLVDGPARLVSMDAEEVVLEVNEPGDVLVRLHHSQHWALDGAGCIASGPDGWLVLQASQAGLVTLHPSLGAGWTESPSGPACPEG
ncbi:MAG TPA: hypothetical protein VF855_00475 [Acidimicrobiales bacterium]